MKINPIFTSFGQFARHLKKLCKTSFLLPRLQKYAFYARVNVVRFEIKKHTEATMRFKLFLKTLNTGKWFNQIVTVNL